MNSSHGGADTYSEARAADGDSVNAITRSTSERRRPFLPLPPCRGGGAGVSLAAGAGAGAVLVPSEKPVAMLRSACAAGDRSSVLLPPPGAAPLLRRRRRELLDDGDRADASPPRRSSTDWRGKSSFSDWRRCTPIARAVMELDRWRSGEDVSGLCCVVQCELDVPVCEVKRLRLVVAAVRVRT